MADSVLERLFLELSLVMPEGVKTQRELELEARLAESDSIVDEAWAAVMRWSDPSMHASIGPAIDAIAEASDG